MFVPLKTKKIPRCNSNQDTPVAVNDERVGQRDFGPKQRRHAQSGFTNGHAGLLDLLWLTGNFCAERYRRVLT
jgi:hypothetical protein